MGTVVLLVGPKAVGKSWLAELLQRELRVLHVDPDPLVSELLLAGAQPDTQIGWLEPIEAAVLAALETRERVSVEATGEWESDYMLAERLQETGHRVLRVRLIAAEAETIARLAARQAKGPLPTETEARLAYARSMTRAATAHWDLVLDMGGVMRPREAIRLMSRLI